MYCTVHCMPYGERLEEEGAVDLLALVAPHPEVHLHEPAEDPDDDGDHKENREDALRLVHLHGILGHEGRRQPIAQRGGGGGGALGAAVECDGGVPGQVSRQRVCDISSRRKSVSAHYFLLTTY